MAWLASAVRASCDTSNKNELGISGISGISGKYVELIRDRVARFTRPYQWCIEA